MNRFVKIYILFLLSVFLCSCYAVSSRLWFDGDVDWPSVVSLSAVEDGGRGGANLYLSVKYHDEGVIWIHLYSDSFSESKNPVMYSSGRAYLEKEGGKRVLADPSLYVAGPNAKKIPAGSFYGGVIPDKVLEDKRVDLTDGGVSLRFATSPPLLGEKWKVHFGEIEFGGRRIAIQDKFIVLRKGGWRRHSFLP